MVAAFDVGQRTAEAAAVLPAAVVRTSAGSIAAAVRTCINKRQHHQVAPRGGKRQMKWMRVKATVVAIAMEAFGSAFYRVTSE